VQLAYLVYFVSGNGDLVKEFWATGSVYTLVQVHYW
jgi:hypothetical protein